MAVCLRACRSVIGSIGASRSHSNVRGNLNTMTYQSTKKYEHNAGFSCCFRQWRADSHCRFLHGYPLAFKFVFEADELDSRNWVVDFGSLKSLKGWLENTFDHKTLVARDDPFMSWFLEGHSLGAVDVILVDATGCEKVAELVFVQAEQWLNDMGYAPRVTLKSVEVSEHSGNSAIYTK